MTNLGELLSTQMKKAAKKNLLCEIPGPLPPQGFSDQFFEVPKTLKIRYCWGPLDPQVGHFGGAFSDYKPLR